MKTETKRRFPLGAEPVPGGVSFRLWAPKRRTVEVLLADGSAWPLEREPEGYFSGVVAGAAVGALYRYRLDGGAAFPDPASRFQPEGPHGPSEVIDPSYRWTDDFWKGLTLPGQVLYELHVGTFTREGTWAAAFERLPRLAELGVTAVEVMPVAEFPGRFGWGYDGVDLFAPTRLYGRPEEFKLFVDRAHALGLGVLLDVVYNHFGPDGCYLREFSDGYFEGRTEWGEAIDFRKRPVRELVTSNAAYWVAEFRVDGLRLDATQQIFDDSRPHVVREVADAARAAAGGRSVLIVAENEPADSAFIKQHGCDAVWNDDFHHSALVALHGRREAYYQDFGGAPQELLSAAKWGPLYQGQYFGWQKKRRGAFALDVPPERWITYLENHDQVSNSLDGARLADLAGAARVRALTAWWLLCPGTPLLFQGQELGSRSPFVFFADHHPDLGRQVRRGRGEFLTQFPGVKEGAQPPDPCSEETFRRCVTPEAGDPRALALHRDLLALRKRLTGRLDGAVLGPQALAARRDRRLLVLNYGPQLDLPSCPEPLLAGRWKVAWCSEAVEYGGRGCVSPVDGEGRWRLLAECFWLLEEAA